MSASDRAFAAHLAYLDHVTAWLDASSLDDAALLATTAPLDARQIAYLVDALRIPPLALMADGDGRGWPLLCARVERVGRLFRFVTEDGEGVPALIIVARDQAGQGVDLVAWSAREDWVASESGSLGLLGREWMNPLANEPVDVHASVLDWLRAERRGVVMVDRAKAVAALRDAPEIIVTNRRFGVELERRLTIAAPKIGVREAA